MENPTPIPELENTLFLVEDLRGLKAGALVLHCMGVQCATLFGGPVCPAGFTRLVLT